MSEEMKKNAMETEFVDEETKQETTEAPKEEAPKTEEKKQETEKVNPVVKVFTAIGNGIAKTGSAIGGAIKKHPFIASGVSGLIGYGVKAGLDYLRDQANSSEKVEEPSVPSEPLCLPETEEPATLELPIVNTVPLSFRFFSEVNYEIAVCG